MPRGNDKEAALHELADRFGEGTGNAEELIQANLADFSHELLVLSDLPRDEEATAELDIEKMKGPNGEEVVDAAVRGAGRTRGTIVLYEGEDGRRHKHVAEMSESLENQRENRERDLRERQEAAGAAREAGGAKGSSGSKRASSSKKSK